MVTDIQHKAPQPPIASTQAAAPSTIASTRPELAAKVPAPIVKAEIRVNTEEMKQNLDQAIRQLNDNMRDGGRNIAFSMDEVLGRPIILVKKQDTGEVIRQIPDEAIVKMAHNLDKLKGLIFSSIA